MAELTPDSCRRCGYSGEWLVRVSMTCLNISTTHPDFRFVDFPFLPECRVVDGQIAFIGIACSCSVLNQQSVKPTLSDTIVTMESHERIGSGPASEECTHADALSGIICCSSRLHIILR